MNKKSAAKRNEAKNIEKIKFTVEERVAYRILLPQQGDILTLTLARDIDKKLRLTQTEMKTIDLKIEDGGTRAVWKKEIVKEIELTDAEITFLQAQVDKLDKEKKLTPAILSLCLKIRQKKG